MKVGFISVPVPGHLNPMSVLARKLQSRNHEVVLICLPDTEPFVRAAGLSFLPCCEKEFPVGSVDEYVRGIGTRQGEEALQLSIEACAVITNGLFNSFPAKLKAVGVDALVLDTYLFYAELLPLSLGMPYVHVSNALHFDYSGYTPLPVYDWPHKTSAEALDRNRKGLANFLNIVKRANTGAKLTRSGSVSRWTGTIRKQQFRSLLGSPRHRRSSTSKVLIGRPNYIIPDHFMTALAG